MSPYRLLSLGVLALAATLRLSALSVEEATIADLHAAYLSGQSSSREVTAAYLARIAAYDKKGPYLNTVINLNPKALEEADALDAKLAATGKPVGPLHGIPVLIKDDMGWSGGRGAHNLITPCHLFFYKIAPRSRYVWSRVRVAGRRSRFDLGESKSLRDLATFGIEFA